MAAATSGLMSPASTQRFKSSVVPFESLPQKSDRTKGHANSRMAGKNGAIAFQPRTRDPYIRLVSQSAMRSKLRIPWSAS